VAASEAGGTIAGPRGGDVYPPSSVFLTRILSAIGTGGAPPQKYPHYGPLTPASSPQFAPFFKEIENMHMAHDLLHQ
jgi:hypothetical protein